VERKLNAQQILDFLKSKVSRNTLLNFEERGQIPKSKLEKRGEQIMARYWDTFEEWCAIGKQVGWLNELPAVPLVISAYLRKGGIGKSTIAENLARVLALNGAKVLIIGLDANKSISDAFNFGPVVGQTIEDIQEWDGLYQHFVDGTPLSEIIQKYSENIDVIPENDDLGELSLRIQGATRREHFFERTIEQLKSRYNYILFDCPPGKEDEPLIAAALTVTNVIVSPVGCDVRSLRAIATALTSLREWMEKAKVTIDDHIIIPMMVESSKLSTQILAYYQSKFPGTTEHAIRRQTVVQEAAYAKVSLFEFTAGLSAQKKQGLRVLEDFYSVFTEMHRRLLEAAVEIQERESVTPRRRSTPSPLVLEANP
jgi:chromosome partitioning protein